MKYNNINYYNIINVIILLLLIYYYIIIILLIKCIEKIISYIRYKIWDKISFNSFKLFKNYSIKCIALLKKK